MIFTKEHFKEFFKHNIPIFIHLVWKNKVELGFAIFGFLTLTLFASLHNKTDYIKNNDKELKETQEQVRALSTELNKYYLLENDLIEAGASPEQAKDIIKSTDMLHNSNLARSRLGK
jgi:uncharacterized protein YecE (DUF72 family)